MQPLLPVLLSLSMFADLRYPHLLNVYCNGSKINELSQQPTVARHIGTRANQGNVIVNISDQNFVRQVLLQVTVAVLLDHFIQAHLLLHPSVH